MKAEEIRTHQNSMSDLGKVAVEKGRDEVEYRTCWVLHEIAAQLAELNFTLGTFSGLRVSLPDWCSEHQKETLLWRGFHYCPECYPAIHKEALSEAHSKCRNG